MGMGGQTRAQDNTANPQAVTTTNPQSANMNQLAAQAVQGGMAGTVAAGGYQPMNVQAGAVGDTDLSSYQNPYTQQVVDANAADIMRSAQMGLNTLGAQAQSAGAFGGSRHGVAMGELGRGALSNIGQQSAALRQAGFQQAQQAATGDINRQMQADLANQQMGLQGAGLQMQGAQQLANLGNLGFGMGRQVQSDLMNQGNIQQLMQQQLIDAARQQFAGYTSAPASTIGYVSQALGASPIPQSQTTQNNPGLFDYLTMGASLVGMSDMRLKTNVERVGDLPNGLGLYTWDWTEDAKEAGLSNSMNLGVIAQEVREVMPENVVETPSGYLAVRYDKVYEGL